MKPSFPPTRQRIHTRESIDAFPEWLNRSGITARICAVPDVSCPPLIMKFRLVHAENFKTDSDNKARRKRQLASKTRER